jgi:hypothetical protein
MWWSVEAVAVDRFSTAKISDHIAIDFIGVNLVPDLQEIEEVHCMFYPNGTADEFVILLRSDQGEIRKVTTKS